MPRLEAERQLVSGDSLSRAGLRSRLGAHLELQLGALRTHLILGRRYVRLPADERRDGVRGALRAFQSRAGTKTYRHYDIRAHTFAKHRREKIALRGRPRVRLGPREGRQSPRRRVDAARKSSTPSTRIRRHRRDAGSSPLDGAARVVTGRCPRRLEAHCYDALMQGASFCGGVQGGALAVTPGPRPSKFSEDWARAYVDYYAASKGDETSSSWGGDQAPLAALMDAHCNAHPELALPSGSQNNTSAEKWTVGALPCVLNVRHGSERPSDALKCTVPPMGPMLVLHQKRYLKEYLGTRDRLLRSARPQIRATPGSRRMLLHQSKASAASGWAGPRSNAA